VTPSKFYTIKIASILTSLFSFIAVKKIGRVEIYTEMRETKTQHSYLAWPNIQGVTHFINDTEK